MNVNVNDWVKLKPTKTGWEQITKHVKEFNERIEQNHPKATFRATVPQPDKDGYIREQFWSLMQYFEWNGLGFEAPFMEMIVEEKQ